MSETGGFSRLSSIKECPICGGNIDKGYFTAPRGIYWDTEKHKLSAIITDSMLPRISSLFMLDNSPALKCEKCGIAILDYKAPGETPKSFLKECVKCGKEIPIASEECACCGAKQPEHEES